MTAVQSGLTSIVVSWSPANGSTGYMIFYNSSGGHRGNVTVEKSTTSHTLTGLYNGQIYTVSISSISRDLQSVRVYANTVGLSKFANDCVTEVDSTFNLQFQMLQPSAVFHLHLLEHLLQSPSVSQLLQLYSF